LHVFHDSAGDEVDLVLDTARPGARWSMMAGDAKRK
jgi:hypothetical protein